MLENCDFNDFFVISKSRDWDAPESHSGLAKTAGIRDPGIAVSICNSYPYHAECHIHAVL